MFGAFLVSIIAWVRLVVGEKKKKKKWRGERVKGKKSKRNRTDAKLTPQTTASRKVPLSLEKILWVIINI